MSIALRFSFLLPLLAVVAGNEVSRVAVANLAPRGAQVNQSIAGTIVFTETENGLRLTGSITGLPAGNYGFHVHELGDITTCDTSGAHFNPEGTNHGGRDHEVRHVGDLGNVAFVGTTDAVATIDITDNILSLRGRNNIVGRTLVLHAQEDDLGLGGHESSLTTGNAGPRLACGVIGMRYPADPWNSAVTSSPSLLLLIATALVIYLRI